MASDDKRVFLHFQYSGPVFHMNSSSLHTELYLLEQDTSLSNYAQDGWNMEKQLKKYKGIISKQPLDSHTDTSFEIGFTYLVLSRVLNNQVLLQIGIAHRSLIDFDLTLGNHKYAWSISVAGCDDNYLCLVAENDGKKMEEVKISENVVNSTSSKKLIFQYSPINAFLIVSINVVTKEFITFRNIMIQEEMWAALAVYNPALAETTVASLNLELDFTTLHRVVFISDDERCISNVQLTDSYQTRNRKGNLERYRGVVGDIQFSSKFLEIYPQYFEVVIETDVFALHLRTNEFFFEIGFTRHQLVDSGTMLKYFNSTWSVCATLCRKSKYHVCLQTWENKLLRKEWDIFQLGRSKIFKDITVLGFVIDIELQTITIIRRGQRKHIDKFSGVPFDEGVFPVFGVSHWPKISLKLQTGNSIPSYSIFGYNFIHPACLVEQ